MEEGKPSFTAEIGAVIRAIETEKPEGQRLCHDPFAKGFLGKTNTILGMIPPLR
jgi:O-methyltransferase involved in polyketide biosynthesis